MAIRAYLCLAGAADFGRPPPGYRRSNRRPRRLGANGEIPQDPLRQFFEERCRFHPEAKCAWKTLWAAYRSSVTGAGECHPLDTQL
jgi:hypothetical protein